VVWRGAHQSDHRPCPSNRPIEFEKNRLDRRPPAPNPQTSCPGLHRQITMPSRPIYGTEVSVVLAEDKEIAPGTFPFWCRRGCFIWPTQSRPRKWWEQMISAVSPGSERQKDRAAAVRRKTKRATQRSKKKKASKKIPWSITHFSRNHKHDGADDNVAIKKKSSGRKNISRRKTLPAPRGAKKLAGPRPGSRERRLEPRRAR